MNWYNKYNRQNKDTKHSCPRCGTPLDEKIIYFFEPEKCSGCNTNIGFINVSPYDRNTYIIDLKAAPEVFRVMFDYLSGIDQKNGFEQMKLMLEMFQKKTKE